MATGLSDTVRLSSGNMAQSSSMPPADWVGFDLDAWLILQRGNLAVAEEVRALVADAFGEIARTQCRYLRSAACGAGSAAGASAYWGLTLDTAEEVMGHALDAQREIGGLLARCLRVNLAELTTLPL
ncbi:MAG: hypothetical protein AB7I59_15780 [Geminicoccaceae bacterium]